MVGDARVGSVSGGRCRHLRASFFLAVVKKKTHSRSHEVKNQTKQEEDEPRESVSMLRNEKIEMEKTIALLMPFTCFVALTRQNLFLSLLRRVNRREFDLFYHRAREREQKRGEKRRACELREDESLET